MLSFFVAAESVILKRVDDRIMVRNNRFSFISDSSVKPAYY